MARFALWLLVVWLMMKEKDAIQVRIRLVGSTVQHVGQVEVQFNGTWGAICGSRSSGWDINDARVICRMLGYERAEAPIWHFEGLNTTKIHLDVVRCKDEEVKSLTQCKYTWWNITSGCTYKSLAGVVCRAEEDPLPVQVRLAGGTSPNSGRVEVRYHGAWGTVCNDGWSKYNAEVVCFMLGYPGVQVAQHSNFSSAAGISWLKYLHCVGSETSIDKCHHHRWGKGCVHTKDVGVACKAVSVPKFKVKEGQPCTLNVTLTRTGTTPKENDMLKFFFIHIQLKRSSSSFSSFLVPGSVSNFTIGDGKTYNGHHNAPLEPGTTYKIAVGIVNKAQNGGSRYGDTESKTFTTSLTECAYMKGNQTNTAIGCDLSTSTSVLVFSLASSANIVISMAFKI